MNHDPNAHAIDERTQYNLRTVKAPNLRSPDCRTVDQRVTAELVRIVDALQVLTLKVELLEEHVARIDAALQRAGVTV